MRFREEALNGQRLASVYRVGFGLLTLTALVVQYLTSRQHPSFSTVDFFSYFTTLSNLLGAVVFLCVGLSNRRASGAELARGAVTLYLGVTFIVYAVLLSDIPLGILRPWINTVLHQVMPLAVVLDWVCVPPKHRLEMRRTLIWLVFPLVFLAYSLIRGARVDWYPYPFLNPGKVAGYAGVAAYCVAITIVFLLLTVVLTWLGNYMRERPVMITS